MRRVVLSAVAALLGCSEFRFTRLDALDAGRPAHRPDDRPEAPPDAGTAVTSDLGTSADTDLGSAPATDRPEPAIDRPEPVDLGVTLFDDVPAPDQPAAAVDAPTVPRDTGVVRPDIVVVDVGPRCSAGLTECASVCVNLSDDARNCGRCGTSCVSGQCSGGLCVMPPPCGDLGQGCCAGSCNPGLSCQSGTCRSAVCTLGEAASCTPGAAAPGCCTQGRSCTTTRGGPRCCRPVGGSCSQQEGCCGEATCSGGVCRAVTACLPTGTACEDDGVCCPNRNGVRRCVYNAGSAFGRACAEGCASHSECATGCCAVMPPGGNAVCAHPRFCAASTGCYAQVAQLCDRDESCCAVGVAPRATVCEMQLSQPRCTRLCATDLDCGAAACRADNAGVWRCMPRLGP